MTLTFQTKLGRCFAGIVFSILKNNQVANLRIYLKCQNHYLTKLIIIIFKVQKLIDIVKTNTSLLYFYSVYVISVLLFVVNVVVVLLRLIHWLTDIFIRCECLFSESGSCVVCFEGILEKTGVESKSRFIFEKVSFW